MIYQTESLNELSAILSFFKTKRCTQRMLAGKFSFVSGNRLVTLDKTTLSSIKKKPQDKKYIDILSALKKEFALAVTIAESKGDNNLFNFFIEIEDNEKFTISFQKYFGDLIKSDPLKHNSLSGEVDKLTLFENVRYAFYDRLENSIDRHLIHFNLGGDLEIFHADGRQKFKGRYRLDKTNSYLLINTYLRSSKEKEATMQIPVGQGQRPKLCLGLYLNMGPTGHGCESCTMVLHEDTTEKLLPRRFYYIDNDDNLSVVDKKEIPVSIRAYLKDPKRNRIAVPKHIVDLKSFDSWMTMKGKMKDGGLLEETHPYLDTYHMFYNNDGLRHYEIDIYAEYRDIKARISHHREGSTEPVHYGTGKVSRYRKFVYIDIEANEKKSFIQMEVGGEQVEYFECFCGIVTGTDAYQQKMVAYPIVVVRKSVYDNNYEHVMKHVNRFVDEHLKNRISIDSPERLRLENL